MSAYRKYYVFAKEFGWTPNQVDEMLSVQVQALWELINEERKLAPKGNPYGRNI